MHVVLAVRNKKTPETRASEWQQKVTSCFKPGEQDFTMLVSCETAGPCVDLFLAGFYVYVCRRICIYIYIYIHTYIHAHVYAQTCARIYAYGYARLNNMCVYTYVLANTCVSVHALPRQQPLTWFTCVCYPPWSSPL